MASGLAQGALVRTPRIHGSCCRLVLLDLPVTRSGLGVRIGRAFRSQHLAHLTSGRQGYAVLVSSEVTSLDLSAWLTSRPPRVLLGSPAVCEQAEGCRWRCRWLVQGPCVGSEAAIFPSSEPCQAPLGRYRNTVSLSDSAALGGSGKKVTGLQTTAIGADSRTSGLLLKTSARKSKKQISSFAVCRRETGRLPAMPTPAPRLQLTRHVRVPSLMQRCCYSTTASHPTRV